MLELLDGSLGILGPPLGLGLGRFGFVKDTTENVDLAIQLVKEPKELVIVVAVVLDRQLVNGRGERPLIILVRSILVRSIPCDCGDGGGWRLLRGSASPPGSRGV